MKNILSMVVVGLLAVGIASCGADGSSDNSLTSLTQVPDAGDMLTTNSGSGNIAVNPDSGKMLKAVSGTPPLLSALGTGTNADTYFWNGLISTINTAGQATDAQAEQFWGVSTAAGAPGGEISCRMAQSTGYTMENIIRSGTSLCYMKNMPNVISAASITDNSGLGLTAANFFDQLAADKLIKVNVSGEENFGNQDIYIKVYGTNSVGSDVYRVDLWFCGDGAVGNANQYQQISVTKSTGALTIADTGSMSWGGDTQTFATSVSGTISVSGDTAVFDPTASRTASFTFDSSQFGTMKSALTVSSDNYITAKEYSNFGDGGGCINKIYSKAGFSGTSMSTLRFREAGLKAANTCTGQAEYSFNGGSEFSDTYYAAANSSALATEVASFVFASDSFFASAPAAPTIDTSSYSCVQSPDVEVAMDMSDATIGAVATTCEGKMVSNMSFCDSSTIAQARGFVFAAQQQP